MPHKTVKGKTPEVRTPMLSRQTWTQLLLCLALFASTWLLYAPVGRFAFLSYDDEAYVTSNPHMRTGLTGANVAWAFTSLDAANWHPLTWLSHLTDAELFGINPAGHHYSSVFFHAVNVVLLFLLLLGATGYRWRSFLVSALFALHPLNLQCVAWVAERKSLLSTLFLLLALAAYGWYLRKPGWGRSLVVAIAFAAALMAKPMAVTFPFMLLLLDYWPLGRLPEPAEDRAGWAKKWKQLLGEKAPLFALSAASCWITVVAQKRGGAMHLEAPVPYAMRLMNALYSYFEYVRMMVWPTRLGIFYPYPILPVWKAVLSGVFLAVVTVLVLLLRRRKYLVFGWFLYLGALVPMIGLVQVGKQGMADRYAYLPMIGLCVIFIWLAAEAIAALRVPRGITIAAAAVLLLATAAVARVNLGYWTNSITVFTRARQVASRPDLMIEVNLGESLFAAGALDEGLAHYRVAEQLDPRNSVVHYDIAVVMMKKAELPLAEQEFQLALRNARKKDVVIVSALNNLGMLNLRQGNLAGAWNYYTAALEADPNHYSAMLGRAVVLERQQRLAEAEEEISRSLKIHPSAQAWWMLGRVLEEQGKTAQAAEAYAESKLLQR